MTTDSVHFDSLDAPPGAAPSPEPPYTAVIFTSQLADDGGYAAAASRMEELAAAQPGYVGIESARGADGIGITVSYWADDRSARDWKQQLEHLAAQREGIERWYGWYRVRVATVHRQYGRG